MPRRRRGAGLARALAIAQGTYFFASGIWPLLHYRSFERVTGPKRDDWLVKTVGVIVACIGATLIRSGRSNNQNDNTRFLAMSSALGLIGIDVYYSGTGRISKVYLLDAALEAAFALAWLNERSTERNELL